MHVCVYVCVRVCTGVPRCVQVYTNIIHTPVLLFELRLACLLMSSLFQVRYTEMSCLNVPGAVKKLTVRDRLVCFCMCVYVFVCVCVCVFMRFRMYTCVCFRVYDCMYICVC